MTNFIYKYIIIILILYIIYNLIPSNNIIKTDIYIFISLGLLIFYFINKYLFNINEYFDQINPVTTPTSKKPEILTYTPQILTFAPNNATISTSTLNKPYISTSAPQIVSQIVSQIVPQTASTIIAVDNSKNNEILMIYNLQNKINDLEKLIKTSVMSLNSTNTDTLDGDMKYNQLTSEQMIALGAPDKTVSNKWDNTYTLLNTDKWKPPVRREKVCKQEKTCPVCPSITSGYPLNVMDYDKSRYIMGPDNISIEYIKNLNNPIKS